MDNQSIRVAAAGETIWDRGDRGSIKGLHLRAFDLKKIFYLFYRTKDGRQRKPKIGNFGDITLAEARKRAKAIMDRVAIGEDPKAEWDIARGEMTAAELFEKIYAEYWSLPRFVESTYNRSVRNLWSRHLDKPFARLRLSEIDPLAVRKWHSSAIKTPYSANRALKVLSRMLSFAEEHGLKTQGTNPCKLVSPHQERKRKRFATLDELKKLGPILKRESKTRPDAVAFIYLLLFSGSRPLAIERATWDQLRIFQRNGATYGVLTFKGKSSEKTGEDETVVIPPQAMEVIQKLPKIVGHTITGTKLPRRWWKRIKAEIGCDDLRVRDFRRTFASIGISSGVGISVIGELLNHSSSQTTKIYAKLMDGARVDAALQIASKVEGLLK